MHLDGISAALHHRPAASGEDELSGLERSAPRDARKNSEEDEEAMLATGKAEAARLQVVQLVQWLGKHVGDEDEPTKDALEDEEACDDV